VELAAEPGVELARELATRPEQPLVTAVE